MSTATETTTGAAKGSTGATTQVFRIYIKATPEAIWDAITKPEWTERYGYTNLADYDLRPGGAYVARPGAEMAAYPGVPEIIVDGEVIEADPPRRLVQTWRMLMDPALEEEGFTRLTYDIQDMGDAGTKLTITHELENAPGLAQMVSGALEESGGGAGGGWAWVLSDLKSLLETGTRLAG